MSDPCVILLVEDNQDDAFLISRAFQKLGFPGRLQHVWDAEAARRYLTAGSPFDNRKEHPVPQLLITDSALNDKGSGLDLIEWVRGQSPVENLPCILFTGAASPEMQRRAEAARTNAILIKNADTVESVRSLWEAISNLLPHSRDWIP